MAIVDHVLHTDRLILHPVTADDHALLLAHWAAPDVRRFLFDGAMLSAAEITEAIEDSTRDFGLVYENGRTDLVGTAGLRPLEDLGLEIFYSVAPASWGKGNAASIAVIERLGMTEFEVVPGLLGPMARYRKKA